MSLFPNPCPNEIRTRNPAAVDELAVNEVNAAFVLFLAAPAPGAGVFAVGDVGFRQACHQRFLDLHAAEWTGPRSYELRDDARRFENWERNLGSQLAMGVAIEYAMSWGVDQID